MKIFDNKIDKKTFIAKNIIYILAIIAFFTFWDLLGPDNAFVGVAIVHGSTLLFDKDLTANPFKNIGKFFIIYLYIGIFPFLASLNIYTGLIINFLALFFITYSLVYDLKKSIWAPFVLGYLFLLINPISISELPKRLLGLSLGSLFLLLTQFIINKNRSKNTVKTNLKALAYEVSDKINLLINEEKLSPNDKKISSYIENIVNIINENKDNYFYINNLDNTRLNFSLYLERLNYSLYELEHDFSDDLYKAFLIDLSLLLKDLVYFIETESSEEELIEEINLFTKGYEKLLKYNYSAYEIIQNMDMLKFSLNNFNNIKKTKLKITSLNSYLNIPKKIKLKNILKLNFNPNSLKFSYAFKLSFLISTSYFIVQLFKIPFGEWITITLYAVVQPYAENSKERFTQRFIGTVGGIILFMAIILCFHSNLAKILIFLVLYYIYMFMKDYDKKIICITAIILGVFFMLGKNPYEAILYRFLFMLVGILIGSIGIKYIMPFDSKAALKNFTKDYYNLSKDMLDLGMNSDINENLLKELSNKLFIGKLLEDKILLNNSSNNIPQINEFIYNERILNNNIYFLFFSINNRPLKTEALNKLKINLKEVYDKTLESSYNETEILNKLKEEFRNNFNNIDNPNSKLISITIYRILLRFEISNSLSKKINLELMK